MLVQDRSVARIQSDDVLLGSPRSHGYLEMFNLFRVIACLAVLSQHSFIWANMSGNFVGTGFITMLHLSRNSFFFLTGLVVCYSQLVHPRTVWGFWKRRYWEIGIPYLAWTGIYLVFSLITVNASWNEVGAFLRHSLPLGYSQLYFVAVIFQFYLVFPLLFKLMQKTRHHWWIMATSLAFTVLYGLFEHYRARFAPASDLTRDLNNAIPLSRDVLSYQEYLVAGMLVALHFDQVLAFVARRYRQIWVTTGLVGVLEVLWYMHSVFSGDNVQRASDIYMPTAALWCLAAVAGIFSFSWWWDQRSRESPRAASRRKVLSPAYLAALTGGVFFGHTLFIEITRSTLDVTGLRMRLPWEAVVAILFVGVVSLTGTFAAVVLRTPLRWVLGGPVRSEQRASYNARSSDRTGSNLTIPGSGTSLASPPTWERTRPVDSVSAAVLPTKGLRE
jgi:peptidoglycan/LPS O-acetylase OafA/YrhL